MICVFELGTWGLSPDVETVNMAVVIHEQCCCHCHSEKAKATEGNRGKEERRRVEEIKIPDWQNPLEPLRCHRNCHAVD